MKENWISVALRLPDEFTFVLATIESPDDKWVEIVGFASGKFQLPGRNTTELVTHWMPIPNPAND